MKKRRIDHYEREAYVMAELLPAIIVIGIAAAWVVKSVSKPMHH